MHYRLLLTLCAINNALYLLTDWLTYLLTYLLTGFQYGNAFGVPRVPVPLHPCMLQGGFVIQSFRTQDNSCVLFVQITGMVSDARGFTNYSCTISACTAGGCTESLPTVVTTYERGTYLTRHSPNFYWQPRQVSRNSNLISSNLKQLCYSVIVTDTERSDSFEPAWVCSAEMNSSDLSLDSSDPSSSSASRELIPDSTSSTAEKARGANEAEAEVWCRRSAADEHQVFAGASVWRVLS